MEQDSTDDEVAFHLLPKKCLERSNLDKCLICQTDSNETVSRATDGGIAKFVEASRQREDKVYERLKSDLAKLHEFEILWHRSCYATYTSAHNLRRMRKRTITPSPDNENDNEPRPAKRATRSRSHEVNWSLCLFCQKKIHKKDRKLISVTTFSACDTILKCAEERGDSEMLTKIRGVDLIAAEAKYHFLCRSTYVAKRNITCKSFKETSDEDLYAQAFLELATAIQPGIQAGKAYTMTYLLSRFKACLEKKDIEVDNYRTQRLKGRLQNYFQDSIVFHQQSNPSKPELIYSSDISLEDVINAASSSTCEKSTPTGGADSREPSRHACKNASANSSEVLFHAAQILKAVLKSCEGINTKPVDIDDLTLQKAKSIIPQSLYWLLRWTVTTGDPDIEQFGDLTSSCSNESDERQILMIGQDIIHCASHGRKKMPKQIGLGMTVRHLTGSKQVLTILNRMGHSTSYDDTEAIETSVALEILAIYENDGVVIPTNIVPNAFVQVAADNNDILEETLDGKETTHSTSMVLFQRAQFGHKPTRPHLVDHSQRRRALKATDCAQTIRECGMLGKRPRVTTFINNVKDEWFKPNCSLQQKSLNIDLAWAVLRMCPTQLFEVDLIPALSPDQQTVASWSAFNALVSQPNPTLTEIGYCPMIAESPTEFSTVYTVMKQVQKMMILLGQKDSVITFDLAIYMKAKQIQWKHQDEFSDTVIRMGGFHIALNYLAVVGKQFQDSGLEDLLIESDIYGSSTASALLKGKSYNRGVRAHKLVMEAMLRLQWQYFVRWLQDRPDHQDNINEDERQNLNRAIQVCRDKLANSEDLGDVLPDLCRDFNKVHQLFSSFKNGAAEKSSVFAFWNLYIDMVGLLLALIRAEREGDWLSHLSAVAAMVPHFFAMDRTNYARWLPVYLADMYQLPEKHPEVHSQFLRGNHSVSRSSQPFSQVWTDMALEQSINLDFKKGGGIIGITKQPGALDRWFLTCHERAAITSATKVMCGLQESQTVGPHKESRSPRIKRDEADVQKLLSVFTSELMRDPFTLPSTNDDECIALVNIATGVVMPPELSTKLLNSVYIGTQKMESFINERLNSNEKSFWDPLPQLKLPTFAKLTAKKSVKSTADKLQTIKADRELFGRLIIVAKTREVNLRDVLSYELSSVPFALAHSDGTLRKTQKSALLDELEKNTDVFSKLPPPERGQSTAYVLDGMATVQMIKTGGTETFGSLAVKYWEIFTAPLNDEHCKRVDIVFDRYDRKDSIKGGERAKRGASVALEVNIASSNTPLPRQWAKYISNPTNKANLVSFLSEQWCDFGAKEVPPGKTVLLAGCFKDGMDVFALSNGKLQDVECLRSDHEEADTRMVLHASHASTDHQQIIIQSPDTDVAVLCLSAYSSLICRKLWFRTGTKDKLRFIPIHQLAEQLGQKLCSALPGFHAITGCDSTSAFAGMGKKKSLALLKRSERHQETLACLGENVEPSGDVLRSCEGFICDMYSSKNASGTADEMRYILFCQKQKRNENLPPTSNSLKHHVERANYQALVWKRTLERVQNLPTPIDHGWALQNGILSPVLMSKDPAPVALLELTSCRCQKSACRRGDLCKCKAHDLRCTEACLCMAGEMCENNQERNIDDSDDEE